MLTVPIRSGGITRLNALQGRISDAPHRFQSRRRSPSRLPAATVLQHGAKDKSGQKHQKEQ